MNLLSSNQWTRLAILTLSFGTLLGATACGGKSTKADRAPTERRTLQSNTPAPTPEILKDSPCGNPDWAKPPGSQGEDPVDPDFRATSRKGASANDADEDSVEAKKSAEDSSSDDPAPNPAEKSASDSEESVD